MKRSINTNLNTVESNSDGSDSDISNLDESGAKPVTKRRGMSKNFCIRGCLNRSLNNGWKGEKMRPTAKFVIAHYLVQRRP